MDRGSSSRRCCEVIVFLRAVDVIRRHRSSEIGDARDGNAPFDLSHGTYYFDKFGFWVKLFSAC